MTRKTTQALKIRYLALNAFKRTLIMVFVGVLVGTSFGPVTIGQSFAGLDTAVKVFNKAMDSDVMLQGVLGGSSFNFNMSPYWEITNPPKLEIIYSSSGSKSRTASTLSIFINDQPLKMVALPVESVNDQVVRLEVPLKYLKVGSNEVRVKTWHTITDQLCEDDSNPGNWISIQKNTNIQFAYREKVNQLKLSDFPYPFMKLNDSLPSHFEFLVDANQISQPISQALATFSSELGHMAPYQNIKLKVSSASDLTTNGNYIYLGSTVPDSIKTVLPRSVGLYPDKVTFYTFRLQDRAQVLLVLSKDESLLNEGVKALCNPKVTEQLKVDYAEVDQRDLKVNTKALAEDRISFKDLGYGNVQMRGVKETSTAYFVDFPDQWLISKGARLILNVRYTDQIDSKNSSLTVVVNNMPLGSVQLDPESSREKIVTFDIPDDLLTASSYNIVVKYYLSGNVDCNSAFNKTDYWNFTSNESLLELPHTIKSGFTFKDFPAPFIGNGAMEDLSFVMADPKSLEAQTLMANVAGYIGHQLMTTTHVEVSYDALSDKKHLIIIGHAKSPMVQKANNDLNIPFKTDGKAFKLELSPTGITSIKSIKASAQLLHKTSTPYSQLWLVVPDSSGYSILEKIIADLQLSKQMEGDSVFIDDNGYVQSAQVREMSKDQIAVSATLTKAEEKDNATAKRVSYENARNFVIFGGVLLLAMAIAIFIINSRRGTR